MTARQSPTMIRNLDPAVWDQLKVEARRHDLAAGELLNVIARAWLAAHQCTAYGGPLVIAPGGGTIHF